MTDKAVKMFKNAYMKYYEIKNKYDLLFQEYKTLKKRNQDTLRSGEIDRFIELGNLVKPHIGSLWYDWKRTASDYKVYERNINPPLAKQIKESVKMSFQS